MPALRARPQAAPPPVIGLAKAILFLASDDAASITGQALAVDGGTLALSSGYSAPRSTRA
ncbi:SDR family oxidoreductase [Mesorhizobium sp. A556]